MKKTIESDLRPKLEQNIFLQYFIYPAQLLNFRFKSLGGKTGLLN